MKRIRTTDRVPMWVRGLAVMGAFGTLLWLEHRRPLRRPVEPGPRRDARNLAIAGAAGAAVQLAETPVVLPLTELVERRRWGLLKQARLPVWLEVPLAVALMDYTLYLWHVLTHRVPFLWRFHQPHHVDLDLSASTALRFHFGEMVVSVPWRAAQVLLIGTSPLSLSAWQTATLVGILFHHSNVRLPLGVELVLCRVVVTPRMHGIHHSMVPEETNSNWSSGIFAWWDWLHGTHRLNVPQGAITIGIPAYQDSREVTLPRVLAMPFGEQRPSQRLPDGGRPGRGPLPTPSGRLSP